MSAQKVFLFVSLTAMLYFPPDICYSQVKRSVSTNFPELLEKLLFISLEKCTRVSAEKPIAREIRYIYASALELKGKAKDPFVVSNESKGYKRQITPGTEWVDILDYGAESIDESMRDYLKKYDEGLSAEPVESYLAMNRSVQTSIATLQIYLSAMGALSAMAKRWAEKEANSLVSWTETKTKCIGEEAPDGSILHLDIMWLTKGQSFKFHSESDIMVTATLETADGRMIGSQQFMQKWIDTKKKTVSPAGALPMYESITEEKKELLSPFLEEHGILPLQAVLINAAVEDLYLRMEVLDEIGKGGK